MYEYRATIVNVVDGDTFDLDIDLGFRLTTRQRIRLSGHDTPELRRGSDVEKQAAKTAKQFVQDWFEQNPVVTIRTSKSDSFGRWLAEIHNDDNNLGTLLLELGLATKYPTKWREVHDNK